MKQWAIGTKVNYDFLQSWGPQKTPKTVQTSSGEFLTLAMLLAHADITNQLQYTFTPDTGSNASHLIDYSQSVLTN